jgi:hypothetical protein
MQVERKKESAVGVAGGGDKAKGGRMDADSGGGE